MKLAVALLAGAVALGVVSCGGTNPPPQTTSHNDSVRMTDSVPTAVTAAPHPAAQPGANPGAKMEGDPPPANAQFTIFCDALRGPNHVMTAAAVKEKLIAGTGLRNWHILHSDEQSAIYYGYYTTFNDKEHFPQETTRAQDDLRKIESLKNAQGDRMFTRAIFLPINNPDPDAPPQWNLANTPPTAYWSLQIAAFRGFPERKQAAVAAVRSAREAGVEAYYFHGETISSVCIGAWPADAIKRQDADAATSAQSDSTLFVLGDTIAPIDPNMHDREGHKLTVQAPKLEILDLTLKNTIRKFPDHAVNYNVTVRKAKDGTEIRSPSFLVVIEHKDGAPAPLIQLGAPGVSASSGADAATGALLDDTRPKPAGRGQLRGIDQP